MDAIIFDFDGVVVDSEPIHLAGFSEVLRTVGVELTEEAYYSRYLGFDDHDCFVAAMNDYGKAYTEDQIEQMIASKTRAVQQRMAETIQPLPGAVSLIREAQQAGVPLAICSGALREEVELASQTVGVRDCFHLIVAARDVEEGKPHPEGYLKAARQLSEALGREIHPSACGVCEDSPAGISAAKAAGMKVVAITNSYPPEQLAEADRIVRSLEEASLETMRSLVDGEG